MLKIVNLSEVVHTYKVYNISGSHNHLHLIAYTCMQDSRVVKAKFKRIHKRSLTFIYLRYYSNLLCLCFGLRKSMTTSALIFNNLILTLRPHFVSTMALRN